jgi:hypothetical protein
VLSGNAPTIFQHTSKTNFQPREIPIRRFDVFIWAPRDSPNENCPRYKRSNVKSRKFFNRFAHGVTVYTVHLFCANALVSVSSESIRPSFRAI